MKPFGVLGPVPWEGCRQFEVTEKKMFGKIYNSKNIYNPAKFIESATALHQANSLSLLPEDNSFFDGGMDL